MKTNEEILEKLKDKRTKCIVYTRVMGYCRPVEMFNIGKKAEHEDRLMFIERTNKWIIKLFQKKKKKNF